MASIIQGITSINPLINLTNSHQNLSIQGQNRINHGRERLGRVRIGTSHPCQLNNTIIANL